MEKKVEVYKDSNGKLWENRDDYYISELEIRHQNNIELWSHWLELIENEPENYYKILHHLIDVSKKQTDEEIEKTYNEHISFIEEAKRIKRIRNNSKEYGVYDGDEIETNWNKSDGSWLGISAQDLGVPNC